MSRAEFENYTMDVFSVPEKSLSAATHVRVVFPDIHELSFMRKENGFVFLREVEIHGTPVKE